MFVGMNLMNKNCSQFHKDSPSGKKVKFNLASAIELSETADFVFSFYTSEQLRRRITPTFPSNFFMLFSHEMPFYFVYAIV